MILICNQRKQRGPYNVCTVVEKQSPSDSFSVNIIPDSSCVGTKKPYRIWLLFTHESGNVKAISVTERSLAIIGACHMPLHALILTKSVLNGLKAPTPLAN